MNRTAESHAAPPVAVWRASRWPLALLLAGFAALTPFSIDTYLPAFIDIGQSLRATPLEVQQTLSVYLFGFAFMDLFHGALSDCFGRRRVLLAGTLVFSLASVGCALAEGIWTLIAFRAVQGMSCGVGMTVGRALTCDLFDEKDARRLMSRTMMIVGLAPVIAPMAGGFLAVHLGWAFVFWFLALLGLLLCAIAWCILPESLPPQGRQPFRPGPLVEGYKAVVTDRRFLLLALAVSLTFCSTFVYVFSVPTFLGTHLGLASTQYYWLFASLVCGHMTGSYVSGILAERLSPSRQIGVGLLLVSAAATANVLYNSFFVPAVVPALLPIGACAFGFSLLAPGISVILLDLFPSRRGMVSSLQQFIGTLTNGVVASLLAPLVMGSTVAMAWAMAGLCLSGCVAWIIYRRWGVIPDQPG